jgi:hypothetical protein
MENDMGVCGKLHSATVELSRSAPIKQRLIKVFSILQEIEPADLPSALREQLAAIVSGLECVSPLPGESRVQATVRKMSAEQADMHAARVVDLFATVSAFVHSAQPRADAVAPSSVTAIRDRQESRQQSVPLLYAAEA